jgi:hypothetical protein
VTDAAPSMRIVLQENPDPFAKRWDRWRAFQVGTGKIVARGDTRWTCELNARAKGFEEETALERFRRRGNR